VTGFEKVGTSVRTVVAADRRFDADVVVLCAGVWSTALARQLQLKLPVRPAKGYSITLPVGAGPAPRLPVVDHGRGHQAKSGMMVLVVVPLKEA
jgi:D-amino-acid dehydrogenase